MKPVCIVTAPYDVNTWVLPLAEGRAAIIDPSGNARAIAAYISRLGLTPCAILLTHGHYEQIAAIPGLLKKYPGLPVGIHKDDAAYLGKDAAIVHQTMRDNDEVYELTDDKHSWIYNLPEPAFFLEEGPAPEVPGVGPVLEGWEVIHTPGHTEGSVCFYNKAEKLLFTGDTLYYGGYGDVNLPGGDKIEMVRSLVFKLFELEGDTVVLPGAGIKTTIGSEVAAIDALADRIKKK